MACDDEACDEVGGEVVGDEAEDGLGQLVAVEVGEHEAGGMTLRQMAYTLLCHPPFQTDS